MFLASLTEVSSLDFGPAHLAGLFLRRQSNRFFCCLRHQTAVSGRARGDLRTAQIASVSGQPDRHLWGPRCARQIEAKARALPKKVTMPSKNARRVITSRSQGGCQLGRVPLGAIQARSGAKASHPAGLIHASFRATPARIDPQKFPTTYAHRCPTGEIKVATQPSIEDSRGGDDECAGSSAR